MNMSLCNRDTTYTLPGERVVPIRTIFHIIEKYFSIITQMPDDSFFLHDAYSNTYKVLSVSCEQNIIDDASSEINGMRLAGPPTITFIVDIAGVKKEYSVSKLYAEHRDMFDNLVKRICAQSPELIDRVLLQS